MAGGPGPMLDIDSKNLKIPDSTVAMLIANIDKQPPQF